MRVGFVQFAPTFGQRERNLEKIRDLVSGQRADLLVLPELCTSGYLFLSRKEVLDLAEPLDGPTVSFLKKLSRTNRTALVAGLAERAATKVYNSAVLVTPDGRLGLYRKTHLFGEEKKWFSPGDSGFRVFALGRVRIGIMICFDWIFPESARTLALKGAQVICHPANLVLPHCPWSMPVRALENRVFIITADRVGSERRAGRSLRFIGQSLVCSPDRETLAAAGATEECVQIVTIDPWRAKNKRIAPGNDLFKDRRPGLYQC